MGNFNLFLSILTIAIVMGVALGGFAYLTLLERKISAWIQDRKGPNRVGPLGLLQPIADGGKFLLKEEVVPGHVDKLFYLLGPCIATGTALLALAVVPFGKTTPAPELVNRWPSLTEGEKVAVAHVDTSSKQWGELTDNERKQELEKGERDWKPAFGRALRTPTLAEPWGRTVGEAAPNVGLTGEWDKAVQEETERLENEKKRPLTSEEKPAVVAGAWQRLSAENRERLYEAAWPRLGDNVQSDFRAEVWKDLRLPLPPESLAKGEGAPNWPQTQREAALARAADRIYADANDQTSYESREGDYNATYQYVIAPNLDIGIVFVFAVGSLNVYAVILGGWSSGSKYSLLGGLRASAQVISYEIPLGLSVLTVVLFAGSLNLERIIDDQVQHGWNILFHPLAALLFIISIFAECNRLPFDLPECEQELVAGYHTEYSGMKFALFMIGEYTHMITTSFLVMILFFGGWQVLPLPFVGDFGGPVVKLIVLCGKMFLFICFYMLVRWTIPRFRFDQLMGLAWKVMIPLAVVNLVAGLVIKQLGWSPWVLLPVSLALLVGAGYLTLLMPKPVSMVPARYTLARTQAEAATH